MQPLLKNRPVIIIGFMLCLPVLVLLMTDFTAHFISDERTNSVAFGRDFINYYNSSIYILENRVLDLFDRDQYWEFIRHIYGPDMSTHSWSYPPHMWFLTWPLALMPYLNAFVVWTFLGCLAFYKAAKTYTLNRFDAVVLLLAPAGLICIAAGQNGLFTSALLIAAFSVKDMRPRLAGILIGCLSIKPQLGVLIPLVLILMRDWKVITWAGLTVLNLIASSILVFGIAPWILFMKEVYSFQVEVLEQMGAPFSHMVPSLFMGAKLYGLPVSTAKILQLLSSAFALCIILWAFWKKRDYNLQLAILFIATALFSPYIVNYDLSFLSVSAYLYYRHMQNSPSHLTRLHYWLIGFVGSCAILTFLLSALNIHLTWFVLMGFALCVIKEMKLLGAETYKKPILPKLRDLI